MCDWIAKEINIISQQTQLMKLTDILMAISSVLQGTEIKLWTFYPEDTIWKGSFDLMNCKAEDFFSSCEVVDLNSLSLKICINNLMKWLAHR